MIWIITGWHDMKALTSVTETSTVVHWSSWLQPIWSYYSFFHYYLYCTFSTLLYSQPLFWSEHACDTFSSSSRIPADSAARQSSRGNLGQAPSLLIKKGIFFVIHWGRSTGIRGGMRQIINTAASTDCCHRNVWLLGFCVFFLGGRMWNFSYPDAVMDTATSLILKTKITHRYTFDFPYLYLSFLRTL